jgi:hypothetical protein
MLAIIPVILSAASSCGAEIYQAELYSPLPARMSTQIFTAIAD